MTSDSITRLLQEIQALLQSPTSNLTAASLLLAIIVIAALVVLILALLALTSSRRPRVRTGAASGVSAERTSGPRPSPQMRAFTLSRPQVLWASVVIMLAAVAGTYISTSTPEYCGSTCHLMTPAADTWDQSTHAAVSCRSCHESSIADGAISRIRHAVVQAASPDSADLSTTVPAARCGRCHPEALETVPIEARGLRVVHGHFTDDGVDCARCHERVGHEASSGVRPGSMSVCLRCHDGTTASSACGTCHIDDVGFTALEDRSFGRVRLQQPTCGGCHQEDTCDACHGLRMPHPVDYADPHLHARPGAFTGREDLCYRCHTPRDCGECHGTLVLEGGGHAVNWNTAHRQYSIADGNGYCLACHKTEDFCRVCHTR